MIRCHISNCAVIITVTLFFLCLGHVFTFDFLTLLRFGLHLQDHADFFYIDVWSSRYTWGGLDPPEKGSFAVITKGQTILLDTSTPVLKMLLIQG